MKTSLKKALLFAKLAKLPSGGVYLVDRSALVHNLLTLTAAVQDAGAEAIFPMKALPSVDLLGDIIPYIRRFDVTNEGEFELLSQHAAARRVARPYWNGPELPAVSMSKGTLRPFPIATTVEQLELLSSSKKFTPYGIRICSTDLIKACATTESSRFGIARRDIDQLFLDSTRTRVGPSVLHCHHGSEEMTGEGYFELLEGLVDIATRNSFNIKRFNVGGGQAFSYYDKPCDLRELLKELRQRIFGRGKILLEPGALWFSGCLYYVARVLSVRRIGDRLYVGVDGSPDNALKWSSRTIRLHGTIDNVSALPVRVCGATCYEDDVIGDFKLDTNDDALACNPSSSLVFSNVSPYSVAQRSGFNGVPCPRISFI